MTDKVQKIRKEVERRYNLNRIGAHSAFRNGKCEALREVLDFIDSLQEVPCNHCQGFNDKEKCDELVFGKSCPLQKKNNSELTEFEKEVKGILFDAGDNYNLNPIGSL